MKRAIEIVHGFLLCSALAGCTLAATPASPAIVLGTTAPRQGGQPAITASVEVVPANVANMSFGLSAPVKSISVREGDQVHAGQALISLDTPDLAFAELAAEAALKSATADAFIQSQGRRKWDGFKFVWMSGPPEQRQEAEAKVAQMEAGLQVAQARLAQATLLAPFDGTVVAVRVTQGETVQPGQVAIVIGGLDHLRVETTDLSERDIAAVHVGETARVRLKAFDEALAGTVGAIAPIAGKSSDGDTIYKVTIELDQQPAGVLWGMTGDVEILTP
jgi:multidrug resistance efflux pump